MTRDEEIDYKQETCDHVFDDSYYGHRCVRCDLMIPYGCEPWVYISGIPEIDNPELIDEE